MLGVGSLSLGAKLNVVKDMTRENRLLIPWRTMPQSLALLFLRHEPAPIDYNSAMVAFIESSLICSDLLRARPRERGTILATKAETTVPARFPLQASTNTQRLQGESLSFTASLHPPYQSNQQYSILSLSDSSGAVVERISYTAYGQPTFTNAAGTTLSSSAKATRYSYTGRELDPSLQLHHFRARWMSGVSGRFLGRDPMGFIDAYNLYPSFLSLDMLDSSGTLKEPTEPRKVARKDQCTLNCCCCPGDIDFAKGNANTSALSGYFKAFQPFTAGFNMEFVPRTAPLLDPLKESSECLLEWWEYRFDKKVPYNPNIKVEWIDGIQNPEASHSTIFDDWFTKPRPQECTDKKGKAKKTPFKVSVTDEPGIHNGSGRESLTAYIAIELSKSPGCKCRRSESVLILKVSDGRGFFTLERFPNATYFDNPPGPPPN